MKRMYGALAVAAVALAATPVMAQTKIGAAGPPPGAQSGPGAGAAGGAQEGGGEGAQSKADENVVDAEFEEVRDKGRRAS